MLQDTPPAAADDPSRVVTPADPAEKGSLRRAAILPLTLLRRERRTLAAFAAASLGRAALIAASILLIREFLGGVLGREEGFAGRIAAAYGAGTALWLVAATLLVVTLGTALLTYASRIYHHVLVKAIELGTMERLVRTLLGLSVGFYDRRTRGDLLHSVQQDVAHLRTFVMAAGSVLLDLLQALALVGAATLLSPRLAFWAFVLVPLAAAPIYLLAQRTTRQSFGIRRRGVVLLDMLFQLLGGIRAIRIYHGEETEARRAIERARRFHQDLLAVERVRAGARVALDSIAGLGLVIVLIVGGYQVLAGTLGWPELLAFLLAVRASHTPLHNLTGNYLELQRHAASLVQIHALLSERPEVRDAPDAVPLARPPARLAGARVGFHSGGVQILDDVSFEVAAGETLGIVGASGAGKTTLLNLIARLYDPTTGAILYDGVDVRRFRIESVHRQLALVAQDPFLFSTTIRENIRFGRPGASDLDVEEAARAAEIHDEILAMPLGYETVVGQGARPLSRGEAQRVNIARAILKDAPVLLLDEATSSLDSATEARVQRALDRLAEGRLTISIAHRLSTLRRADRILVLDKGRAAGLGTHDTLLQTCPAYRVLWESQMGSLPAAEHVR